MPPFRSPVDFLNSNRSDSPSAIERLQRCEVHGWFLLRPFFVAAPLRDGSPTGRVRDSASRLARSRASSADAGSSRVLRHQPALEGLFQDALPEASSAQQVGFDLSFGRVSYRQPPLHFRDDLELFDFRH